MAAETLTLLRRTTCPHCWHAFPPEDVLWVAAHADLVGDPRLGPEQPQRFLPTRFNLDGNALDARGFACQQLACPRCHLPVPRLLLETEPSFVSILGTPACGKSFYLTALTWELRRLLPEQFLLGFADADPAANRQLNEYEESLFLNPRAHELFPLADLIRKTELQGDLYDAVSFGSQTVTYPRPFLFSVRPRAGHPSADRAEVARVVCLYDNAGEHFQPGRDSAASPVTQHLARAQLLLFLFDPTQDPRFQAVCRARKIDLPALAAKGGRQELVLTEAATRVRRALGLPSTARHDRPLIIVVTKFDCWSGLLGDRDVAPPWVQTSRGAGLDRERVEKRSAEVRALLQQGCPELVTAAEDFANEVVYVPVSALGRRPVEGPRGPAIRPCDIRPAWVTVPLLYGMCRWMARLVPGVKRTGARPGAGATANGEPVKRT
jgi:hypothetical protein